MKNASAIESKLGYSFRDRGLLALAFVHCSYVNEHKELPVHNERLEFLGDSILGLLVAEYLYRELPEMPEGELSPLRSRLVDASACAAYVQKLAVGQYLLLGKGERMSDGRGRDSISADLFEALVAAIYLDGGIEAARTFFFRSFGEEIHAQLKEPIRNWKAILQDYCQRTYQQTPTYSLLEMSGPDHSRQFRIAACLMDQQLGIGTGSSKKEAQQAAAADALVHLGLTP